MKIVSKIWRRLSRLPFAQEYLCVDAERFGRTPFVYELRGGRIAADATGRHCLVGYSPVLIAFPAEATFPHARTLLFCSAPNEIGQAPDRHSILAALELQLLEPRNGPYGLYEATSVRHRLLPFWKRRCLDVYNRQRQGEAGNVHLPGNRYQQVQVAYSVPRAVCLIALRCAGGCNLFPTDLHGPLGPGTYLISLRQGGKACAQVQEAGGLLLAEMAPEQAGLAYRLGKNHMQAPQREETFPFSGQFGGLPVPEGATRLRHLRLRSFRDVGIHRLLYFTVEAEAAGAGSGRLAHVHAAYATWRLRHGLAGNYLPR